MNEPTKFTAGDTVSWTVTLSDYPASDSWALTYALRGPANLNVTATADGSSFIVEIAAADSAKLLPGQYRYQGYVTKGAMRQTVARGSFEVEPNLVGEPAGYEGRTDFQRIMESCLSALDRWSKNPYAEIEIAGRRKVWREREIRDLYSWAYDRQKALERQEARERGEARSRRALVEFE